ncbi:MAG: Cna B-type domain-containing protein, partial [Peptoniphilus grossensis]
MPQTVTVKDNTYEIKDGVLTVKFNAQDPNYGKLKGSANVKFTINNDFKVTEEITEIAFSDEIKKETFVVDEEPDNPKPPDPPTPPEDKKPRFDIRFNSKYGPEQKKAGKVKYTLEISVKDKTTDLTNVTIDDLQLGDILNLDRDSFEVKGQLGGTPAQHQITFKEENGQTNGFTITFPTIKRNETTDLLVEFTATVDYDKIHGKEAGEDKTRNDISVTCVEAKKKAENWTFTTIPYFDVDLIIPMDEVEERHSNSVIWRDYGDGTTCPNVWPFVPLRIKLNDYFHRDMGNAKIWGRMPRYGESVLGFDADKNGQKLPLKIWGLNIVGKNKDGKIVKQYNVPLDEIGKERKSDTSYWTYTLPQDAGNLYYEIDFELYSTSLFWYKNSISTGELIYVNRKNADDSVDGGNDAYKEIIYNYTSESQDDLAVEVSNPTMDWTRWRLQWESIVTVPSCYEASKSELSFYPKHNLYYRADGSKLDSIYKDSIKVYEEVEGAPNTWKEIDPRKEKFEFSGTSSKQEIQFFHSMDGEKWNGGFYPKAGKHRYKITFETDLNDYLGHNLIKNFNYEDHGATVSFQHGNITATDSYDEKDPENGNYFRYYPERLVIDKGGDGWSGADGFTMCGGQVYIQNFPTDQPRDIAISLDKEVFELGKDQDGKIQMNLIGGAHIGSGVYSTESVPVTVTETEEGYVAHIKTWPTAWRGNPPEGAEPRYYFLGFQYKVKKDPDDKTKFVPEFYKRALQDPEGKVYLKSTARTLSEKWKLDPKESRSEWIVSNEFTADRSYKAQQKTVSTQKDANGNTIANYKLIVNQSGTDYLPEDDFLILEDTMSPNMSLVYGSLKFHNIKTDKDDNLKWTYDSNTKVLKANIPDGVPYKVTYTCLVTGTGKQKLSNTATISGQGKVTSTTTETVSSDTTGSATIPFITIQKVDKDAYQIPLKGAEFKLYEKVGNAWEPVQKDGADVANYITDDSGKAIIVAEQDKDGWALQYDKEYAVKEVTPPEGYYINKDFHPFILKKEPTEGSNFYTLGQIKIIEDEMITCLYDLSATKILKDTNGKLTTLSDGSFSFQLDIAKSEDANVDLSALKFEPLDILRNKADGSITSSLKLRGVGTHVLKLREIIPEKVEEGDKYDKTVYYLVVKVVKDTSVKEGLKVESAKMYKGDLNTSVEKFEFTNTIGKIRSIDVEKIWQNLPDDANKPEVTVKLLKDGVETNQVLKLNKDSWTGTFSNLPLFKDDGTEIAYSVKEVGEENGLIKIGEKEYNVAVTGNASSGFKITNMPKVENISLKASKVWASEKDATLPSVKPEVTFDLYADGVKVEGQSKKIVDKQSEATWENLPKTSDNGTEIVYTVKEAGEENGTITLDGKEYTVTTSGNAKEGFTITNTIKKIVPETVTVKA